MTPFRIAIAGLGTVGGGVVKAIEARGDDLSTRAGRRLEVSAVSARDATKDRGFRIANFVADPLGSLPEPDYLSLPMLNKIA